MLDGRNRLAACEAAGVAPTFTVHAGDPVAYIVSANITRRHLNAGQRAMLVAEMRARLPSKPAESARETARALHLSPARLSQAETVRQFTPHLTQQVMAGEFPLNEAYEAARRVKRRLVGDDAPEPADQSDHAAQVGSLRTASKLMSEANDPARREAGMLRMRLAGAVVRISDILAFDPLQVAGVVTADWTQTDLEPLLKQVADWGERVHAAAPSSAIRRVK